MHLHRRAGRPLARPALEGLEPRWLLSSATLRIVTYNIEADINGDTVPLPGMATVLEGIGQQSVIGTAQPIDVLALEETTSNSQTVQPIVDALNSDYGSGTYALSSYQAGEVDSDPTDGNGPNALIYNAKTLTLLASVGVGTPQGSTNGEFRQVVRYEFQPIGGTAASDFYIYVSHYKSGSGASNDDDREDESKIIRADEATLPASARVLYIGDFNDSTVAAPAYQTLVASGQGQAFDPANPTNSDPGTSPADDLLSEAATALQYRDDYQMMTSNVLNDSTGGLAYVSGSLEEFGNNGSVGYQGDVDSASNTALPNLPNRSAVLQALTTASDHLPVVADYTDPLGTAAAATVSGNVATSGGSAIANVMVYLDLNNNSTLDTGEQSTTTSAAGTFSFANVPAGQTPIIRQVLPSGYTQTLPGNGYGVHLPTLVAGSTYSNENFVDAPAGATISGLVSAGQAVAGETIYLDANNNSKLDSGELSTTTNSSGSYSFTGVPAGAYIIRQILPTGYQQTSPSNGYGIHITVSGGSTLSGENFTDTAPTGSIAGTVFNDANGDGIQDNGESGLSGWTLFIDLNNSGIYITGDPTATTDSAGDYLFSGLTAGTYIVRVERPSGYSQTTPANNLGHHATVAEGQKITGEIFGERTIA